MNRLRAVLVLVVTALFLVACSSTPGAAAPTGSPPDAAAPTGSPPAAPDGSPAAGQSRTSDGGQVTVVVDWAGPAAGAVFDVTLDTHSVDLDALDLGDALLRNDRGETMGARPWTAPKGGHHREGTLAFDGDATVFLAGAEWVELVLTGIGDLPERTLRWEIPS